MQTLRKLAWLSLLAALALAATSCSSCAEKLTEKAVEKAIEKESGKAGQKVDIDLDKEGEGKFTMTAKSEDGKEAVFQVGAATKLPEGFPKDVPIIEGAKPTMVMTATAEGGNVMFEVDKTPEAVRAFYKEAMPKGGWTAQGEMTVNDYASFLFKNGERTVHISVSVGPGGPEGGKSSLIVQYGKEAGS